VNVLVTGAKGFVGKNLCAALRQRAGVELVEHDLGDGQAVLDATLRTVDVIFHLAGVNRPERVEEFETGNTRFTAEICRALLEAGRRPKIVLSSTVHAGREDPYGKSKLGAEQELKRFAELTGADVILHRLKNLYGKWSRPNYNSVVATFCHNVARGLPITISDPASVVYMTYSDDVGTAFVAELGSDARGGWRVAEPLPSHEITLGELARLIESFRAHRATLVLPDFASGFVRTLWATYLSYVPADAWGYQLVARADQRGSLAEFVKSQSFGQIFVSRTKPGITRGNHYHHTKTEKFMVVEGDGIVRLRQIHGNVVAEFRVRGDEFRVVDIPPGVTHSIENVGDGELVTLFWSSEIFDPARPDTMHDPVIQSPSK